ncbi:carbohydrate kinase family protein [Candidatus Gottesmanbacteria bacterium]|nr:carbohydrate kinase family protein [Candidatus Gottesmanbacteria bacterium]
MNILVTGTLGYDYIMDFDGLFAERIMPERVHNLSLSFLVDSLSKQRGGTAGNIAYSLHLLKLSPLLLSSAGNDFGPYFKEIKQLRMNTKGISLHRDVSTGSYFVVTDKADNQIGSFYIGASKYNKDISFLPYIQKKYPNDSFAIISPNIPDAMKKYVRECLTLKIPYMYDPAFQIGSIEPDELKKGITGATIVIANDYEIGLMQDRLEMTHEELIAEAGILITTLGSRGSIIETMKDAIHIKPAKPKEILDPTGAGDAYRAGFITGFLKKFDLPTCGQMGSVTAAYTVEAYGTQTHVFTVKDFCLRYEENFYDSLLL